MPLVRVKGKYQVTIPAEIRKELNLKVGDYLEVEARGSSIVLRPKAVIDREKEEAWERLKELLERVHQKIGEVPEEEVERDVLEAIRAIRGEERRLARQEVESRP
jgi:AbrB family looped-hinge helix DNA binding protein